jgi:hypothetical protein
MARFHRHSHIRKALAVLAAGMAAMPAYAQTLGLAPSHEVPMWRVVGALLFCCALGAAGAFALKYRMRNAAPMARGTARFDWRQLAGDLRLGPRPAAQDPGRLKVVETVRLGYQVEVNLLECDGKSIVIVASPHGAFVAGQDAPDKAGTPS